MRFALRLAVSEIHVSENRKCTEWPQTELEDLTVKSTLYTLNTYPWGPNFCPFRSTISRFQDKTYTRTAKIRNAPNDPNWTWRLNSQKYPMYTKIFLLRFAPYPNKLLWHFCIIIIIIFVLTGPLYRLQACDQYFTLLFYSTVKLRVALNCNNFLSPVWPIDNPPIKRTRNQCCLSSQASLVTSSRMSQPS